MVTAYVHWNSKKSYFFKLYKKLYTGTSVPSITQRLMPTMAEIKSL